MAGIFYGVGVGPGDPELLTLKAIKAIEGADVIIAPQTEKNEESAALAIAGCYIPASTPVVKMTFPMVMDTAVLGEAWERCRDTILSLLREGKKVIFLTLGDPMLYGTYIYIHKLLKDSGCPVETIPGITSFSAVASRTGVPLAQGDEVLSIVPVTGGDEALDRAMGTADNLVLMKVYRNYNQVVRKLKQADYHDTVMVSKCGCEDEEVYYDLDEKDRVSYFSTIIAKRKGLDYK